MAAAVPAAVPAGSFRGAALLPRFDAAALEGQRSTLGRRPAPFGVGVALHGSLTMTNLRTPRPLLWSLRLLAALASPFALAQSQGEGGDEGPRAVSASLMDALARWSNPLERQEAAALERHPVAIRRYASLLSRRYRGGLLAHLAATHPQAHPEIAGELPADTLNDDEALAWLMSARETEYRALQAEP